MGRGGTSSDQALPQRDFVRFELGRVTATPGALDLAEEHGIDLRALLMRHLRGDWGDLGDEDKQLNEEALKNGARIFSAYGSGVTKLYVITDAATSACPGCFGLGGECPGRDVGDVDENHEHWLPEEHRLTTTVLQPSEY
jgi:hypothetical protein